jgi:hypothetical protein
MATAPRPGAGARAAADQTVVTIKVDGETYEFRPGEVTARQVSEVRKETGMSVRAVMEQAQSDPDLDTIGALIYLARCQRGEDVTVQEVYKGLTYGVDLELEADTDDPEDDSPEA